jgi:bile acid:Na+ symporter, BASS family
MSFAAAFILLATICTVIILPLLVPLLIKGLSVNTWTLAKPLLIFVLLPLIFGISAKVYIPGVSNKFFPIVKKIGNIFLLVTAVLTFWLYWPEMLSALGSLAIVAQALFFAGLIVLSYKIGFRLGQKERSAMALGMGTRNMAAVFVAYLGIANPDPGTLVMLVLVGPLALVVAFIVSAIFARQAGKAIAQ